MKIFLFIFLLYFVSCKQREIYIEIKDCKLSLGCSLEISSSEYIINTISIDHEELYIDITSKHDINMKYIDLCLKDSLLNYYKNNTEKDFNDLEYFNIVVYIDIIKNDKKKSYGNFRFRLTELKDTCVIAKEITM